MRLSAAQTRALKQIADADWTVNPDALADLLLDGLVHLFAAVDDHEGECLAIELTAAGRRVLKEEAERDA